MFSDTLFLKVRRKKSITKRKSENSNRTNSENAIATSIKIHKPLPTVKFYERAMHNQPHLLEEIYREQKHHYHDQFLCRQNHTQPTPQ
jgi:hypothetical protein